MVMTLTEQELLDVNDWEAVGLELCFDEDFANKYYKEIWWNRLYNNDDMFNYYCIEHKDKKFSESLFRKIIEFHGIDVANCCCHVFNLSTDYVMNEIIDHLDMERFFDSHEVSDDDLVKFRDRICFEIYFDCNPFVKESTFRTLIENKMYREVNIALCNSIECCQPLPIFILDEIPEHLNWLYIVSNIYQNNIDLLDKYDSYIRKYIEWITSKDEYWECIKYDVGIIRDRFPGRYFDEDE